MRSLNVIGLNMAQMNVYQATIVRKAWFRNKLETTSVVAPNRTQALKDVQARYPKQATVTLKFVSNVRD